LDAESHAKDQKSRRARRTPLPARSTWDGAGVNFALFSANATKVEVCLFDKTGEMELQRIELPEYTDEIWHGYVPDLGPGTLYGYRVSGPYAPEEVTGSTPISCFSTRMPARTSGN